MVLNKKLGFLQIVYCLVNSLQCRVYLYFCHNQWRYKPNNFWPGWYEQYALVYGCLDNISLRLAECLLATPYH